MLFNMLVFGHHLARRCAGRGRCAGAAPACPVGARSETNDETEDPVRYRWQDQTGLTIVELLIAIVMLTILMGLGFQGVQAFSRSAVPDRAASVVAADIGLARSYAVQRAEDVSLVADEANRSYEIRNAGGDVLQRRSFGASTDLPLTVLDVQTPGDDITFNARGMLAGGASSITVEIARFGTEREISVNALGRTRISTP